MTEKRLWNRGFVLPRSIHVHGKVGLRLGLVLFLQLEAFLRALGPNELTNVTHTLVVLLREIRASRRD